MISLNDRNASGITVRSRLVLAFCIWLLLAPLSFVSGVRFIECRVFDFFSTFSPPAPENTPVIIVGIDEPSFAELQLQWPWPREIHGQLIDRLSAAGASVIALDIVFAEPSNNEADQAMAESIRRAGNVILASEETVVENRYVAQLIRVEPLDLFLAAGAHSGVAAVSLDGDGVIRKIPSYSDGFALNALRVYRAYQRTMLGLYPEGPRLIQFFGPAGSYPTVSYYQALDPENFLPPAIFKDKIVIVGRTVKTSPDPEARQSDTFATPFTRMTNRFMAGAEVQAVILDNLRLGFAINPAPRFAQPVGLAFILLLGMFLFRGWQPWIGAGSAFLVVILISVGSYALLRFGRIWLPPPLYIAAIAVSYMGEGGMAFLHERRNRRQIRQAFDRYLSPVLVDRLAADPSQLKLGGETRIMTIMFCDVRGFTTLAERYKENSEGLVHLMNRFFTAMTTVILRWEGTVDKYVGDCIMAFWNAPLDDNDHARHACSAAVDMFDRLDTLNLDIEREMHAQGFDPVELKIGIGINTGLCVVGNMGSDQRFNYSVLGDVVNIAARLEGQTKEYGVGIIIGQRTVDAVSDCVTLELDLLKVKGKNEAERIFALLRKCEQPGGKNWHNLIVNHTGLLKAYRRGDWDGAQKALHACRTLAPELISFYNVYDNRIKEYRTTGLPLNWKGIHEAQSK